MDKVAKNTKAIRANKSKIYALEATVMWNKAEAYRQRAMIEENRAQILKNYSAAFMGNRQIANQNTDDIFRNRLALLDSMAAKGQVQENFVNSMMNSAKLDYLEHMSRRG